MGQTRSEGWGQTNDAVGRKPFQNSVHAARFPRVARDSLLGYRGDRRWDSGRKQCGAVEDWACQHTHWDRSRNEGRPEALRPLWLGPSAATNHNKLNLRAMAVGDRPGTRIREVDALRSFSDRIFCASVLVGPAVQKPAYITTNRERTTRWVQSRNSVARNRFPFHRAHSSSTFGKLSPPSAQSGRVVEPDDAYSR